MNIGDRIGDYEIVEILGAGGMGQVYKVRNTLSERIEAMKVLLPNLESDPGLADRFLREIKMQATLDHPNIAKLYTAMRLDNQLLMFMEFVPGVSLAQEMEAGPVPPGAAAAITAQVLDALGYAHAHGVVHRDIKPANIMLSDAGAVKLMDFGIARAQADTRLTKTGSAVGSLHYMSPEQIRGAEPDLRSDLYSLGVTLYEMVTGRRPFGGDSDYQIMSAHLQEVPVAPIEVVPGVPPDLSEIILMAMAKDPAGRFQSAAAFRGALVNVFPGIAAPAHGIATGAPAAVPQAPVFSASTPGPLSASAMFTAPPAPPSSMPPPSMPPPMAPPPMAMKATASPYTAPPPPLIPIAPQPAKSRRGLYMALGSVVTVAILIAAVIEGPKLIHGGSSGATGTGGAITSDPARPPAADIVTPPEPPPATDTSTPGAASGAASATSPNAPAASVAPSSPGKSSAQSPTQSDWHRLPPAIPSSTSSSAKGASSSSGGAAASMPSSNPGQGNPAGSPPVAAQPPAQPPVAQPPSQPPSRPAVNPEFAELRERHNELAIRAGTARAGLRSFETQQSRQGFGLRGDIREAQTRMDFQLQEAMMSIQNGDIEGARQNLRYAQSAIETIEKFLGR